jgi:hypothetical protein
VRNIRNISVQVEGLSGVENWGRWSDGNHVKITINVPKFLQGKELQIKIPLVHILNNEQRIRPHMNERSLPEMRVTQPQTIAFMATSSESAAGKIVLTLDLPDAESPIAFGAADTRILAIGFKEMIIEASHKPRAG